MTLDYLTLDSASPALLLGPLLTWPPISGTALPADTGPCSATTNWAAWGLYREGAASQTLDSPRTITMAPTGVQSWPSLAPAVSSEFTPAAKLGLQSVCDWVIHSTNVHFDVYSMTSTALGKRCIRMEHKCFSYQNIPLSAQASLLIEDFVQGKLLHSIGVYRALSMCQPLFQAFWWNINFRKRNFLRRQWWQSMSSTARISVMWPSIITKPLWAIASLLKNGGNNSN